MQRQGGLVIAYRERQAFIPHGDERLIRIIEANSHTGCIVRPTGQGQQIAIVTVWRAFKMGADGG